MTYQFQVSRCLPALQRMAIKHCLILALAAAGNMQAQTAEQATLRWQGISLSNVSIYSSYSSAAFPAATAHADYDTFVGGGATIMWNKSSPQYSFALSYVPSYTRDVTHAVSSSSLSPLNQVLSFSLSRQLSTTWEFSTSVSASVLNTTDFLFQTNRFSRLTDVAATPDELAATVLDSKDYNNGQLAALLTGAPLLQSPAQRQFFGDRILNASFRAGASHTKSRLTVSLSAGGSRIQALSSQTTQNTISASPLVPAATSGQAGATVLYAFSPRTHIGVAVVGTETVSRLENAYTSTVTAQLGRRISMRWMVDLHAGTGVVNTRRSIYEPPSGPQFVAGGSVGLKAASHSVLFSADRSVIDQYGLGANSTINTTAAWNWGRPNRGWKVSASGGIQQFHIAGFSDTTGWQGNLGFSEALTKRLALYFAYAYLQNSRNLAGLPGNWSMDGVRMGLIWNP